jgi:tetratricopeptide (TPR) repeat protein
MFRSLLGLLLVGAMAMPAVAIESTSSRREREMKEANAILDDLSAANDEKDWDGVIEAGNKALKIKSIDGKNRGQVYLLRGNAYVQLDKCAEALPDLAEAIELLDPRADIYAIMATCDQKMKAPDMGLANWSKAIELDPKNGTYRSARCVLNFNGKAYPQAIEDCTMAVDLNPSDKTALTALAASYENSGNKPQALTHWRKLATLDPGNENATKGIQRTGGQ